MTIDDTTIQGRPRSTSDEHAAFRPELDLAKYHGELAEFDISDQQKDELLGVLYSIMTSFVQLGFDVKICGQILESFAEAASEKTDAVQSSQSPKLEKPAKKTREEIDS